MPPNRDGGSNDDRQQEERLAPVEAAMARLFAVYDAGVERCQREPVVLLVDCQDETARRLAEELSGVAVTVEPAPEQQDDAARGHAGCDGAQSGIATRAICADLQACRAALVAEFPYLAPALSRPRSSDELLAVAIAEGAASAFRIPFRARP